MRDTGLPHIDPADGRKIEIVATGLPIEHGIPVAVDCTMVSPLHTDGSPWPHAATVPGISFDRALQDKTRTYPELVGSPVLRLLVATTETGGRCNGAVVKLLDQAAAAKARSAPVPLQGAAARSWRSRWTTMLAIAAQDALTATLVDEGLGQLDGKLRTSVFRGLGSRRQRSHTWSA